MASFEGQWSYTHQSNECDNMNIITSSNISSLSSPLRSKSSRAVSSDEHRINNEDSVLDELISPQQISNFDWGAGADAPTHQPGNHENDWVQQSEYATSMPHLPFSGICNTTYHPNVSRRFSCPGIIQQPVVNNHVEAFTQHQFQAQANDVADVQQHPTFNGMDGEISFPPLNNVARRNSFAVAPNAAMKPPTDMQPADMQPAHLQPELSLAYMNIMQLISAPNDTAVSPQSGKSSPDLGAASIIPTFPPSQGAIFQQQPQPEPIQVCGLLPAPTDALESPQSGEFSPDLVSTFSPSQGSIFESIFEQEPCPEPSQVCSNPTITSYPTRLSIPSDKGFLDPVHNFLRSSCIEVFFADERNTGRGAKPTCMGQVGLRCVHCKHAEKSQRAKQAVSFPSKLSNIFESVRNFQRTHLHACEYIPEELKGKYNNLMHEVCKKIHQKYLRAYYAEAGCEIGLMDTQNGIVFGAPPNLSGTPSKKLQAIMKIALDPVASAHLEELIFPKVDRSLENMKFSHIATANTRQVIASCRQQKTVFVHPSDFPTISDFRFVLYHQFCPCRPPSKVLNRRKIKPEKWDTLAGLCCVHCARASARSGERCNKGMYFPLDLESLNDSSFSHNLNSHVMTCEHAPRDIREALAELQRLASETGVSTKRGSKKKFMKKLWERMSNYYPAP